MDIAVLATKENPSRTSETITGEDQRKCFVSSLKKAIKHPTTIRPKKRGHIAVFSQWTRREERLKKESGFFPKQKRFAILFLRR